MSLRTRVVLGMGIVAVVLLGAAVMVTQATRTYLVDQVDNQLRGATPPVVGGELLPRRGAETEPTTAEPPGFPTSDEREGDETRAFSSLYIGTVVDGELVTIAVPNLSGDDAPGPLLDPAALDLGGEAGEQEVFTTPSDAGSSDYRVLVVSDGEGGALVVGQLLDDVDAAATRVRWVVVGSVGLALWVLALVTWWVLRLGVRPVKQMTVAAASIAHGDLSHRIPSAHGGTEAEALGDSLNQMLERIEGAFAERTASEERLRRFVADASHELRTPVTTVRGYAELFAVGGLDGRDQLVAAMGRIASESARMGVLVDDLLLLARLDQGPELSLGEVDVGVIVIDAAADARVAHPGADVRAHVEEGVVIDGDEVRLRQVVANLVHNAIVHTPHRTRVDVSVREERDVAVIEVRDDGPGLSPEEASHAFERFWRAETSRSRVHGGSGLGLAIVAAIVEAHGGAATLTSRPGDGVVVRVELPARPRTISADATVEAAV